MKIEILNEAEADLIEGFHFYDSCTCSTGLPPQPSMDTKATAESESLIREPRNWSNGGDEKLTFLPFFTVKTAKG